MQSVARLIDRDIPTGDERILRTYCGEMIPEHVRIAYWHYKIIRDKGGLGGCQAHELAMVVLLARMMLDEAPQENPLKPFDVAEWAQYLPGEPKEGESDLRMWWRSKETRVQFLQHFPERKETKVLLYEDITERTVPDDRILGPWPAEELQEA